MDWKEGQHGIVRERHCGHQFRIGELVVAGRVSDNDDIRFYRLDLTEYWYLSSDEVEHVQCPTCGMYL